MIAETLGVIHRKPRVLSGFLLFHSICPYNGPEVHNCYAPGRNSSLLNKKQNIARHSQQFSVIDVSIDKSNDYRQGKKLKT